MTLLLISGAISMTHNIVALMLFREAQLLDEVLKWKEENVLPLEEEVACSLSYQALYLTLLVQS